MKRVALLVVASGCGAHAATQPSWASTCRHHLETARQALIKMDDSFADATITPGPDRIKMVIDHGAPMGNPYDPYFFGNKLELEIEPSDHPDDAKPLVAGAAWARGPLEKGLYMCWTLSGNGKHAHVRGSWKGAPDHWDPYLKTFTDAANACIVAAEHAR